MSGEDRVEQYLAEALPHSRGTFSWDDLRMAELLAIYLDVQPDDYGLHCLAAATAGGATFFRMRRRGASTIILWDGAVDLDQIGPQGNSAQAALGLALHCAARQGRVELTVSSGSLNYHPDRGWKRAAQTSQPNRLTVTHSRWWQAFTPSPVLARLRSGGMFAPLECTPKLPWRTPPARWAVSWGELPRPVCQARDSVQVQASSWGRGCAFPGGGNWWIVVSGVAYEYSRPWGSLDLVWWGEFPLDLNRSRLVDGEELEAWFLWLAVELASITAERHWEGVPLELLLEHGGEAPWNAPWYTRANGQPATLGNMQDHYDRWGFLPVVGVPRPEGDAFLFADGFPAELQALFPNWAYLPSEFSRLPEGEPYLARIPLSGGGGEVGLRANPGFGQRVWGERGWIIMERKPHGIDLSLNSPSNYLGELVRLYTCLLEQECSRPAAATFHVASFLDYLLFVKQIRQLSESVSYTHPAGAFGHLALGELMSRYPIRMLSGQTRNLAEILEQADGFVNPASPDPYVCDYLTFTILWAWRSREMSYRPRSSACQQLLNAPGTSLLERILADPECAAAQALKRLPDCRPRSGVDFSLARREMGNGSNILTTFHLLLAMTEETDRPGLLHVLPEFLELENERDLAAWEAICTGELRLVWLWGKIDSLLRRQNLPEAGRLAREAASLFSRHWLSAYLTGICAGFGGDYDAAYRDLDEALARGGPGWLIQQPMWQAAFLSRRPLAQMVVVVQAQSLGAQILAASVQPDPQLRVATCRTLLENPDCPLSVYEVLGNALAEQGEGEAARHCWRLFLAARHDQLMEFDLPARQQRVREKLR
jgi:hypothetical protein